MPVRDVHGHVVGALSIMSREPRDFDNTTVTRLTELAAVCSARVVAREILERLSTAERSASTVDRINRVLLTFSEGLGATATTQDVAHVVTELAHAQLDVAYSAVIVQVDGRFDAVEGSHLPEDLPMEYSELQASADHPGPHSVADGQPRFYPSRSDLVASTRTSPGTRPRTSTGRSTCRSVSSVPTTRLSTGWLPWVGWSDEHVTTPQTQRTKRAVTTYVARALERAELLAARAAVAYTLQSALLTKLPEVPGLQLAARYLPASRGEQVGGDWYDAIHVHGVTTLIIGDVAGHIAAAAQMGNLRSMLRGRRRLPRGALATVEPS